MTLKGRVDGLGRLTAALSRLADNKHLGNVLLASGKDVRDAAAKNLSDGAPPDSRSGELAKSLFVERDGNGNARIGTPLDYGWHLENGTQERPAYPWLTPAFQNSRSAIIPRVRQWLAQSAKRARR